VTVGQIQKSVEIYIVLYSMLKNYGRQSIISP
jgi:hypothetical protein